MRTILKNGSIIDGTLGYPLFGKPHIELALDEVIDIMKQTGVKTEYSHLIFVGKTSWDSCEPMLKKFHALNEQGITTKLSSA